MKRKRLSKPAASKSRAPAKRVPPRRMNGHNHAETDTQGPLVHPAHEAVAGLTPAAIPAGNAVVRPSSQRLNPNFQKKFDTYDAATYPQIASQMVLNGATEKDLVIAFNVTKPILRLWQLQYPEFGAALQISLKSAMVTSQVERSLFEMTQGYEIDAVKIVNVGEGEVKKVKYKKHIPRDVTAIKFWLANRDPTNWGKGTEGGGDGGGSNQLRSLNIGMIKGMSLEELESTLKVLEAAMTPRNSLQRLDVVEAEQVKDDGTDGA